MTILQAANLLQVSPSKVYAMCQTGELAHRRIGSRVIPIDTAVEEFLERAVVSVSKPLWRKVNGKVKFN